MKEQPTTLLGWQESGPTTGEPVRLATLQAPRPNGATVAVYSDGSLAYRFGGRSGRWVRSRLSVYGAVQVAKGLGANLTPEAFIERHIALGYRRVAEGGSPAAGEDARADALMDMIRAIRAVERGWE